MDRGLIMSTRVDGGVRESSARGGGAGRDGERRGSSRNAGALVGVEGVTASPGPSETSGGRAPLARESVENIQRARVVAAMSALVRERGAGGVTVAHVVARSGVSRRTFYELFDDREDCFLAAFDVAIARATDRVIRAYSAEGRWRERVRGALDASLTFMDEEPELGYLSVVGALGGGQRALDRRAEVVRRLVDAVHEGGGGSRGARTPDRLVAEGVVGAILAVIHARLVEQSTGPREPAKPLLGLLNPLTSMVVLPYLGAGAAGRELARPAPHAPRPAFPRADPLRELDMRLTYRTARVLLAIASHPNASNRQVAISAGVSDQGQISKLLARLRVLGLIQNTSYDHHVKGEPNAWTLTPRGQDVTQTIQVRAS
jgi:AcrR family transcriptional regulator